MQTTGWVNTNDLLTMCLWFWLKYSPSTPTKFSTRPSATTDNTSRPARKMASFMSGRVGFQHKLSTATTWRNCDGNIHSFHSGIEVTLYSSFRAFILAVWTRHPGRLQFLVSLGDLAWSVVCNRSRMVRIFKRIFCLGSLWKIWILKIRWEFVTVFKNLNFHLSSFCKFKF